MNIASVPSQNIHLTRMLSVLLDVVSRPSGAIGLTLVVVHLVLALISPLIVPYDYTKMNSALMLAGPDGAHWLGTDHVGRDVFTRFFSGVARRCWSLVSPRPLP